MFRQYKVNADETPPAPPPKFSAETSPYAKSSAIVVKSSSGKSTAKSGSTTSKSSSSSSASSVKSSGSKSSSSSTKSSLTKSSAKPSNNSAGRKKCVCDFPLHSAIRRSQHVIIKVEAGLASCMFNQVDQDGNTPLHLAVERGYTKWVDYLLSNKANVNIVNKSGMTPLVLAVRHSYPHLVMLMLSHGADPHVVNEHTGHASIHYACCAGNKEIMQYLLKQNVKVNVQDAEGVTPLIMACKVRQPRMVELLLDHKTVAKANPNLRDKMGRSPLHWVAEIGDPESCKALIASRADLNGADKEMETPFVRAIKTNNLPVLDVLIEAGCDMGDIDGLNGTAMTMAGLLGRTEVMERLLAAGEDPNDFGHIGFTPLTAAVFESHADTVALLLANGADPNQRNRMGSTPLIKATCFVRPSNIDARHEATKLLIRYGADCNMRATMAGYFTQVTNGRNCALSFAMSAGCLSMAMMHLIGGCRITASEVEEWIRSNQARNSACVMKMFTCLTDWANDVRPLKYLCRQVIRAQLGAEVHQQLENLPLPGPIVSYLQYSDLDDIDPDCTGGMECKQKDMFNVNVPCGLRSLQGTLSYEIMGTDIHLTTQPSLTQVTGL